MPLDIAQEPQDAAATGLGSNRLAVVDSDIHPAVRSLADLRPYVSNHWWEYANTYGFRRKHGSATVELHTDAVKAGDRVLLIDDLIATGGTMMAGKHLLEKLGATVVEGAAIVDLPELGGSDKLRASGLALFTLVDFAGH